MARRLTIITVAATGVAMCVAFLAFHDRENPVTARAAPEPLAVPGPEPLEPGDGTLVPHRPESFEPSAAEPAETGRWSECADAIPDELPPALDGLGEGRTPPIVATLSASGSAEHVLAGALLRPKNDPGAIRADIERALALDSDHPLVLWHALELCYDNQASPYCRSRAFQERVFEQLSSNAAFWARRAVADIERGDQAAALTAMQRAAAVPEIDSYYDEHLLLFERALSMAPDMVYTQRVTVSIGIAGMVSSLGSRTVRVCGEQSESSTMWRDACLGWADRLVSDSDTLAEAAIGYSLMASLYDRAGRDDLARAASASEAELLAIVSDGAAMDVLLQVDNGLMVAFVDELTSKGEIAALKFVSAEVERLKTDPDYDPCALILR